MRGVDRADHISCSTFYCSDEYRAHITQFRVRSVKIGRAQNCGAHSGALIGGVDQVFLLLTHLALEGDWISGMGFANEAGLRNAVRVTVPTWMKRETPAAA